MAKLLQKSNYRIVAILLALFPAPFGTWADNWPAWRGPHGSGISAESIVPIHWSTNQNVAWKAPLPDRGNSTPIIWEQRVFLTQAIEKEDRRAVFCFDAKTGSLLWQAGVTWMEREPKDPNNPPCTPSAVTDGKRVIAWFGSAGVYCYDFTGRELWHRALGSPTHEWGYASSLVLLGNLCIMNFGPGTRSFVVALNKKNGETVWKHDLAGMPADSQWKDYAGQTPYDDRPGAAKISDVAGSWATPLVVRAASRDEVIVAVPLRMLALSARTGRELWYCDGPNIGIYSSPFYGEGLALLAAGGLQNSMMAVTPGGSGNVTSTHRAWFQSRPNSKTTIGSGIIVQKQIYNVTTGGFLECIDLKTGNLLWDQRLVGTGARNSIWSSPVFAGQYLYVSNQNTDVFVIRPGARFECIATNSIGGELMNASLAIADGAFFLRTEKNLWCVREKNE
jgi:outer membrane protein assembly factor BamB